jgi:hypothetical protein
MGHYDSSRPGYCAGCGAAPGNMSADGSCPFCTARRKAFKSKAAADSVPPQPPEPDDRAPLPCPFCGETPTINEWPEHPKLGAQIVCNNDACAMELHTPLNQTRSEAIAHWNTRAGCPHPAKCFSPDECAKRGCASLAYGAEHSIPPQPVRHEPTWETPITLVACELPQAKGLWMDEQGNCYRLEAPQPVPPREPTDDSLCGTCGQDGHEATMPIYACDRCDKWWPRNVDSVPPHQWIEAANNLAAAVRSYAPGDDWCPNLRDALAAYDAAPKGEPADSERLLDRPMLRAHVLRE